MSQLRRYKRHGVGYRIRTARALARIVETAGSFAVMKADFPKAFEQTFTQQVKEVYEAKTS